MKTAAFLSICLFICFGLHSQNEKDSLGLPGDNLDLGATLSIFQKSKNVEEFEMKLNAADAKVNNLDLNHDGLVDYLRVTDLKNKDHHSIVIQDAVSSTETKKVATIEIDKKGKKAAQLEIRGNEELYGKDYIIEPERSAQNEDSDIDDVYATSKPANAPLFVNVWGWPCVSFIYAPQYVVWVSPWYWGYYPSWWSPWTPYSVWWYRHNMYEYGFFPYYRRNHPHYVYGPRRGYSPRKVASPYVHTTNFIPHKVKPNVIYKYPAKRNFESGEKFYSKPAYNRSLQPNYKPSPVFRGNSGGSMSPRHLGGGRR